ncbi:MAG: serine/threonine protein kinase [Microbacteriaceae bacterium]|nr:serine/threonine protein kinase [Microbacteriaceae bacterium]
MARRLPSRPPSLPGFSYIHVLGSGGFADVFLYEQNMPRRQVAVKVMLAEVVNDQVRQMFQAEANLMAQLSAHPSILTVYQASVSSDGRPYLVMEMCSSALSQRYRSERVPVAEVLRIAIKIGSAIETAHMAGVLHRDIKPSNILMTAYGHPVLSDFGIASTLSESDSQQAVGMSIPWSAPEVLMDETAGTIASEVWAFAATVYSLLAGRSPFEIPGESNTSVDLISRINRAKAQPIGRTDVPASLERALATAMSKNPKNRPASVLELVRTLQSVETELGVTQTAVEVAMDDWALATVADLEDRTRVRGVPGGVGAASTRRRRKRTAVVHEDYDAVGALLESDGDELRINSVDRNVGQRTIGRRSAGLRGGAAPVGPGGKRMQLLAWILVACSVLVIALGATATLVLIRASSDDIPVVSDIAAREATGSVTFTWRDPGLDDADVYQVQLDGDPLSVQSRPEFVADGEAGDHMCITVRVSRDGRLGDESNPKCVDVTG